MIYLIYILGTVIIGVLIFIYFILKWFIDEKLRVYEMQFFSPMIIERAYRGRDFLSTFFYTKIDDVINAPHLLMPNSIVIKDDDHKKYLINQYSRKLVEQMMEAGCIEIKEGTELYSTQQRIDLRVKVYQPVLITSKS